MVVVLNVGINNTIHLKISQLGFNQFNLHPEKYINNYDSIETKSQQINNLNSTCKSRPFKQPLHIVSREFQQNSLNLYSWSIEMNNGTMTQA